MLRETFSPLTLIASKTSWGFGTGCVLNREARLRRCTPGALILWDETLFSSCINWILTSCGLMEFISECPLTVRDVPPWLPLPSKIRTLIFIADFFSICLFTHLLTHSFHKSLFRTFYVLCTVFVPEVDLIDHLLNARHCSGWFICTIFPNPREPFEKQRVFSSWNQKGKSESFKAPGRQEDLNCCCWLKDGGRGEACGTECRCSPGDESGSCLTASKEMGTSIP